MCRAFTEDMLNSMISNCTFLDKNGNHNRFDSVCNHDRLINEKECLKKYYVIDKTLDFYKQIEKEEENFDESVNFFFNSLRAVLSNDIVKSNETLIDICYNVYIHYCEITNSSPNMNDLTEMLEGIRSYTNLSDAIAGAKDAILSIHRAARLKKFNNKSKIVFLVLEYLNNNYYHKIQLKDVTEKFDISSSHLCRILKRETGKTYTQLFNEIKMRHAKELLENTNMKAYEVASAIGMQNYGYFFQLYKKHFGKCPRNAIDHLRQYVG